MLAALPSAGVVAASRHADGSLPPVALEVTWCGSTDDAEPVAVALRTHPRLRALLTAAGGRPRRTGWSVGVAGRRAAQTAVGSRWLTRGGLVHLAVTSTGVRTVPNPAAAPEMLRPLFDRFDTEVPLPAADAHALVVAARRAGLPVLRDVPRHALAAVDDAAGHTVTARCTPGMPGVLTLTAGPLVATPVPAELPADAVATLKLRVPDRLLLRADAADAVAVAAASATHVGGMDVGPVLHPWQALFAGRYAATERGMVNALAPGLGKSAAALAALRARHTRHGALRAVVVAPTTSRSQWLAEAARFFPEARVWDAGTSTDLAAAVNELAAAERGIGAEVVLTTPDLLVRLDGALAVPFDDVVVDEATILAQRDSARSHALWAVRRTAQRAMVLTGTPSARHVGQLEPLVEFALGDPDLFADTPLTAAADTAPLARLGAYLHIHDASVPAPVAAHSVPLLDPTALDALVDRCARARVTAAATAASPAQALEVELRAARLGAADPAALLASRYALAADVRAAASSDELALGGAKLPAVVAATLEQVAAGRPVLLVSDFLAPLDTLRDLLVRELPAGAVAAVTSKVSPARRERAVRGFQRGEHQVLLLSGTAHLGLNLQQAGAVLHVDVPATGAALVQRAARAARLGSTHEHVASLVPVLDGTIEDRLADLVGARGLRPATRDDAAAFARRLLTPALRGLPAAS